MSKVPIILHKDRIEMSDYHKSKIRQAITDNNNQSIRAEIHTLLPESREQRGYLHGGLIKLWAYLDNSDYMDSKVCERYFKIFMLEHFPEVQRVGKKIHTFGASSKGSKMINKVIERIQEMLVDEYGLSYDCKAMNPDEYKKWRDELSMGTTDNYLQFVIKMKWLPK